MKKDAQTKAAKIFEWFSEQFEDVQEKFRTLRDRIKSLMARVKEEEKRATPNLLFLIRLRHKLSEYKEFLLGTSCFLDSLIENFSQHMKITATDDITRWLLAHGKASSLYKTVKKEYRMAQFFLGDASLCAPTGLSFASTAASNN